MKSIALSLAVLFASLSIAAAAPEQAAQNEGAVIEEVAAEEVIPADQQEAQKQ